MDFNCPKCACAFVELSDSLQGRPAQCEDCGHEFIVPFHDGERLLSWAEEASWCDLEEAMTEGIGRGHTEKTVSAMLKVFEQKRFEEEWRIRQLSDCDGLSTQERTWHASERKHLQRRSLERLRDVEKFKEVVIEHFKAEGRRARILSRQRRHGADIEVIGDDGSPWAVVRCKVPAEGAQIAPRHVRDFAGAFMLSGVEKGFFFTTGEFSPAARKTAKRFSDWLTACDGQEFIERIGEGDGQS